MKKIVIVGGGISGLFSAYYLNRLNYEVIIIDSASFQYGCSHGNAGLIVPSHIIPLASPGVIPMAIKWMFNSRSPFSFHPKLNKDFIKWCFKFLNNSTKSHVNKSIKPIRDISFLSSALYKELMNELENTFHYQSKGLLMLYKNERTAEEEIQLANLANKYGIETAILSYTELKELDPTCKYDVLGGVHYMGDSHLAPNVLMQKLSEHLKANNVQFVSAETVFDMKVKNSTIESVLTQNKNYEGDCFLLSSGVWTSNLSKKLSLNIPLVSGKGYSFNIPANSNSPRFPSILVDDRVVVTPMGKNLRIAGTMEIDSINQKIRMNRVEGMVNSFNKYYPELNVTVPNKNEVWYGLRPCSPDGLPYIGKSKFYNNLFIAAGHAMLGLSLGPATGKIISEIISETNHSIDINSFSVDRYN